ncbi:MAG: HAMP domain-containing sensor histidine kinase [Archangium sp.]
MRLANKLTLALILGLTLGLTVKGALDVRREHALFVSQAREEEQLLGEVLAATIAEIWKVEGEARAMEIVAEAHATKDDVSIRWVWLDEATGERAPVIALDRLNGVREGREQVIEDAQNVYRYTPVVHGGARPGALEISKSLEPETAYVQQSVLRTVAVTVAIILLAAAMALVFGRLFVGRPVDRLIARLRRIGAGDLTGHLKVRDADQDELALLASEVNALASHLRHADRLTTVGTVAAGVAHELGAPLQIVTGRSKLLESETDLEATREHARAITAQAARMTALIRNLLDYARRRETKKERFELNEVVRQTLNMIRGLADKRSVTLTLTSTEPVHAVIDLTHLQQALTNVVLNAIHASDDKGSVELSVSRARVTPPPDVGGPAADFVRIAIRDHGHGMTEAVVANVFTPFFTTRNVGEGTGLGLPIALAIAREHGGWIAVESKPEAGSTFTLHLAGDEA